MLPNPITTELILDRAVEDPPEYDSKYQLELDAFARSLDAAGVGHSQRSIALQTAGAGGWPIGHFALSFGPQVITALAAVAGAWVQARYGRKVRLKVGDIEVEARTIEEIERLLERAASFQNSTVKTDEKL
jgi:hypothetical protein